MQVLWSQPGLPERQVWQQERWPAWLPLAWQRLVFSLLVLQQVLRLAWRPV